jgi:methionyl-tRNA formyltransferase
LSWPSLNFLGEKILSLPKIGCFNIHTSLLPKYRGAAPIQYALLNGDKTSGVSIQKMVKKMDAGDVAISDEMPIYSYENAGLLSTRLKFQAALSLATLLDQILNQKVRYQTQDESKVTFAPTFKKQDGFINFSTDSAQKN